MCIRDRDTAFPANGKKTVSHFHITIPVINLCMHFKRQCIDDKLLFHGIAFRIGKTFIINLSFCRIFLYIVLLNIRPPEAGISCGAFMPCGMTRSPAVFLRL